MATRILETITFYSISPIVKPNCSKISSPYTELPQHQTGAGVGAGMKTDYSCSSE